MKYGGGGAPENKLLVGKKTGFTQKSTDLKKKKISIYTEALSKAFQKSAFTMAEVLITIGIIGIVAAMTMPTVINNAQNRELQAQLKKTYSELNQMSQLFYTEYGMSVPEFTAVYSGWKLFVNGIFQKYFKISNKVDDWRFDDIDPDSGNIYDTMPYRLYTLSKGKTDPICDVSGYYSDISGRYYLFNDNNGSPNENGPIICVDINGPKGPNMYGKDFFLFVFTTDGYVIPMGQEHINNKVVNGRLNFNGVNIGPDFCKTSGGNVYNTTCAYYAIADVNPQGNGTYWKDFLKGK